MFLLCCGKCTLSPHICSSYHSLNLGCNCENQQVCHVCLVGHSPWFGNCLHLVCGLKLLRERFATADTIKFCCVTVIRDWLCFVKWDGAKRKVKVNNQIKSCLSAWAHVAQLRLVTLPFHPIVVSDTPLNISSEAVVFFFFFLVGENAAGASSFWWRSLLTPQL